MPYASEHSALISEPASALLTRENNKFGDGIHAIMCGPDLHRIQFTKTEGGFKTVAKVKTWLAANDHIALSTTAAGKGPGILTFETPAGKAFDAISGVAVIEELPTQTFLKDLIQVGTYEHPVDGWTLEVDEARMDRWIASSVEMEKNGVDAEVVKDHSFRADDAFGKLHDLFRRPNDKGVMTLYGQHTIIGQDGIELTQRVPNVSIWLEPAFTDGMGRFYGEAILHSSIVQQPVVPDQQGFVPIAASSGRKAMAASLRLSTHGDTPMNIKQWRILLSMGEELTEENLLEKTTEHFKALSLKSTEQGTEIETLTASVKTLEAAKTLGTKDIEVDADAINMLAEGTEMKIDGLVADGQLTPKAASLLKVGLVGSEGARNARALSRTANNGQTPYAEMVLNALKENKFVDLKVTTGAQVLSRQLPGDGVDQTTPDADIVKNMVGGANGNAEIVL